MTITKTIASILIFATTPALAVDLTKAKLPLHYECRDSGIGAGVSRDPVTGKWEAETRRGKSYRFFFRIDDLQTARGKRAKECIEESKHYEHGFKRKKLYCYTMSWPGEKDESSGACELADRGENENPEAQLVCYFQQIALDTDRGEMLTTNNTLIHGVGNAFWVDFVSCQRLDR